MGFSDKKQTAVLDKDMDQVFQAMVQVAGNQKSMKITHSDPAAHQMKLEASMSALSWGTDVLVTMAPAGEGRTQVTVEVKSKMPTELFVGGKHQKTADSIVAELKKALN